MGNKKETNNKKVIKIKYRKVKIKNKDLIEDYYNNKNKDKNNNKRNKTIINMIFIAVFIGVILFFSIGIYIKEDTDFSELENRFLAKKFITKKDIKIKENKIKDDKTRKIADFYKDQFVFRDSFLRIKGDIERLLNKKENNNVVFAKDDYLIKRNGYSDYSIVRNNLDKICNYNNYAKDNKINYFVTIIPRGEDMLYKHLEEGYPTNIQKDLWNMTNSYLKKRNCRYLDMYTYYKSIDNSNNLYYRTDHHWTSYASMLCAKKIYDFNNEKCDFTYDKDIYFDNKKINIEKINNFYGSNYSFASIDYKSADCIKLYRYKDDEKYITKNYDKNKSFKGFYDFSYKHKKDKYSIFLSGNSSRTDVFLNDKKNHTDRPKMIVLKDSFANSIVPFLATKYDLILIDPRYFLGSIKELCKKEHVDNVCVLVNMQSITESKSFMQLS